MRLCLARPFRNARCLLLVTAVVGATSTAFAAPVVPGTGVRVQNAGDDFEDPEWVYYDNLPKASSNIDKQQRTPGGTSKNGRVYESTFRGQPDIVRRVPTPEGGLPGSTGALLMRSLQTGIPGRITNEMQQDDLLFRTGGAIPVSRTPSVVTRVYLPPFDQWEKRTGSSFGFRGSLSTVTGESEQGGGLFRRFRTVQKTEPYWPGFFIQLNSSADPQYDVDSAVLLIRAGQNGHDITGPLITEPGWWTLGMSYTPDGMVHYYAKAGVENLTEADHLTSQFPYGYRAQTFTTFFYNIVNWDNGRMWSTEWIVDDPAVYVAH